MPAAGHRRFDNAVAGLVGGRLRRPRWWGCAVVRLRVDRRAGSRGAPLGAAGGELEVLPVPPKGSHDQMAYARGEAVDGGQIRLRRRRGLVIALVHRLADRAVSRGAPLGGARGAAAWLGAGDSNDNVSWPDSAGDGGSDGGVCDVESSDVARVRFHA